MAESAITMILGFGAVAVPVLGIRFALQRIENTRTLGEAIFVFLAFFFLLLGCS
jgi:hypothetical protein